MSESRDPAVCASPSFTVLFLLSVFITVNCPPGNLLGAINLEQSPKAKSHHFPFIGVRAAFLQGFIFFQQNLRPEISDRSLKLMGPPD